MKNEKTDTAFISLSNAQPRSGCISFRVSVTDSTRDASITSEFRPSKLKPQNSTADGGVIKFCYNPEYIRGLC